MSVETVSRLTPEQRKRLQMEHHRRIVNGEIDLGPVGHSTNPGVIEFAVDNRDRRDPTALGAMLIDSGFSANSAWGNLPMAEVYDVHVQYLACPNYDPGESRATFTARAYHEELEDRAANGDKFAISVLTTGEPGDSGE